jgi:hypothetical protein
MLSRVCVTIDGIGLVIGFIVLFDTSRDYALEFTITHSQVLTAVAW